MELLDGMTDRWSLQESLLQILVNDKQIAESFRKWIGKNKLCIWSVLFAACCYARNIYEESFSYQQNYVNSSMINDG